MGITQICPQDLLPTFGLSKWLKERNKINEDWVSHRQDACQWFFGKPEYHLHSKVTLQCEKHEVTIESKYIFNRIWL